MNIVINKTDEWEPLVCSDSGGYSYMYVDIKVQKDLPLNSQRGVVIHEILECYLRELSHDKIVDLTGYLLEGLRQLEV
jgi:hypothetical protein